MPFIDREFIRFVLVGGVNTVVYYTVYSLCLHIIEWHYFTAHMLGFAISLVGSFFLNTLFTYKVKPTMTKFLKFPLTQLVNIATSAVLLFLFVSYFQMNSSIAPIVAVIFTIPITFLVTGKVLKTT
ncbi:GtrA family protein [Sporosarcina soli]|uniref:GtrA family protein n=1 Tax=Sporosarcina soli TaxID=334736 RepID=A0ABW0TQQ8_9BACL